MLEPFLRKYCERSGPGIWDEPLNAVTNVAFFVAAYASWRALRRVSGSPPRDLRWAALLFAVVGVGSGLWHTLAQPWAEAADAAPIFVLVSLLFASTLRRVFTWSTRGVVMAMAAFVASHVVVALAFPPTLLYGSLFYAPGWLALFVMALAGRSKPQAKALVTAWVTFTVSLVMRTVDRPLCAAVPVGTHFLWHTLNAWLLYRLFAMLLRSQAP